MRSIAPAVEMSGVTVALGGRTVLDGVSLSIRQGEFIGVLGPNGAGKTTLMRTLLGLLPCAAGQVRVAGEAVRRGHRRIGYMPQLRAPATGVRLSGWQFVAAAAGGTGPGLPWLDRAGRAAVDRAIALVDGTSLARRPLAELSGGERQRILLAQALLGAPELLLLDEPLVSLDPAYQGEVIALVRTLNRGLGMAVLFSAHELNPLLGALDRVLYLAGGRAALGTVDEVITGPVLSGLYGAPMEVVRAAGRIFVMSGNTEVGGAGHRCGLARSA